MIERDSYVVIPGWAVTDLNLKGASLIIYSIIYGFSQDGASCFSNSLEYLQEWSNSTRQGVINSIKKLIESKLIIKEESFPFNKYYINKDMIKTCQYSLQDSKQSLPLNIYNNIDNNINISNNISKEKPDQYNKNLELKEKVEEIIKYLNSVCHTNFRPSSNNSKKYIKARLNEGYQVQDFKDVIDFKYQEWGINPVRFSNGGFSSDYLRPSTLFSPKMEEYLHAAWTRQANEVKQVKVKSTEKLTERSDLEF